MRPVAHDVCRGRPRDLPAHQGPPAPGLLRRCFAAHAGKLLVTGLIAGVAGLAMLAMATTFKLLTLPVLVPIATACAIAGAVLCVAGLAGMLCRPDDRPLQVGADDRAKVRPRGKRASTAYFARPTMLRSTLRTIPS